MRRSLLTSGVVVLLVAATMVLGACGDLVVGSGELVTQTYDFSDFSKVEVSDAFEAEITRGDSFEVEVTVDDNIVDRLEVEQDGDTLRIGLDSGISLGTTTTRATVVLPELGGISLSGASSADVAGFASTEPLVLGLSGASRVDLADVAAGDVDLEASGASKVAGALQAGDIRFNLSGASQVELQGTGGDASLEGSGASRFGLASFALDSAAVNLSGASSAEVNVRLTITADLSGASRLEYSGDPDMRDIEVSGGSEIERHQD